MEKPLDYRCAGWKGVMGSSRAGSLEALLRKESGPQRFRMRQEKKEKKKKKKAHRIFFRWPLHLTTMLYSCTAFLDGRLNEKPVFLKIAIRKNLLFLK